MTRTKQGKQQATQTRAYAYVLQLLVAVVVAVLQQQQQLKQQPQWLTQTTYYFSLSCLSTKAAQLTQHRIEAIVKAFMSTQQSHANTFAQKPTTRFVLIHGPIVCYFLLCFGLINIIMDYKKKNFSIPKVANQLKPSLKIIFISSLKPFSLNETNWFLFNDCQLVTQSNKK